MNANGTHTFRATCYKDGSINWVCDDTREYESIEPCIRSARTHADHLRKMVGGDATDTDKGAKVYYEKGAHRFLIYYEVI